MTINEYIEYLRIASKQKADPEEWNKLKKENEILRKEYEEKVMNELKDIIERR